MPTAPPPGRLPPARAGVRLSRPGVLVTAFGGNPDGPGTLLGAWDYSGVSGEVVVSMPPDFKATKAMPVSPTASVTVTV